MSFTLHVGLDVHKDTIAVAIAEDGRGGEVRFHSAIRNSLLALEKLITRLRASHGKEVILLFAYEAGPCGFVIARCLKALGLECLVAAPSLIPNRPGERIKTDPRDALKLVRLLRAQPLKAKPPKKPTPLRRDRCPCVMEWVRFIRHPLGVSP